MKDFRWRSRQYRARTRPLLALPPWLTNGAVVMLVLLACSAAAAVVQPYAGKFLASAASPTEPAGVAAPAVTAGASRPAPAARTGAPRSTVPAAPAATRTSEPLATGETVPATATPVAEPPTDAPTAVPAELAVGSTVKVTGTSIGLSLHQGPSIAEPLVRVAPDGEQLTIVDGPRSADGYTWWKVHGKTGDDGWAVSDFMIPVTP